MTKTITKSDDITDTNDLTSEVGKAHPLVKKYICELKKEISRLQMQLAKLEVKSYSKQVELESKIEQERASKLKIEISSEDAKA